ncbi:MULTISPECIES: hypothetical protein [Photobacterium]|uniref:Lipoprotein n=1 Tax=Photobacterium halotolerans TaxID=265726 RepID=A0A0F5VF73_9GAMM|nr:MULTISPECIES: hypothetical protein [Photobacterium]KKD00774.1 hypothetical protein KY46_06670 [Photobacterium halotolerans]UIP26744.1 hypothetical protein LN341_08775 [Photobacterium sp. TLY01]
MRFQWLLIIPFFCLLTACSSSQVHWRDISSNAVQASAAEEPLSLCRELYKDEAQIYQCEVEMSALLRARQQCEKDTDPSYCVLMAEYTWRHYKDHVLEDSPDIKQAGNYPVMCGYKENQITPCSLTK